MRNIVEQEIFEGRPLLKTRISWTASVGGREYPLELDIVTHPANTNRIIVNYPGAGGHIDGYNEKYKRLATYMQDKNLGAVVRSGNRMLPSFTVDTDLRAMLDYTLENAREISGSEYPDIFLMGASAGASAIAAAAHEYPQVKRILLLAPSGNAGDRINNLQYFNGEVYIVIGDNDEVVGTEAGQTFYDLARNASRRELFVLPNCDHNFKGTLNGRIMSQAPFYAFTTGEKPKFPDPHGGIILY